MNNQVFEKSSQAAYRWEGQTVPHKVYVLRGAKKCEGE